MFGGTLTEYQSPSACVVQYLRPYPSLEEPSQKKDFLSFAEQNGDVIRNCYLGEHGQETAFVSEVVRAQQILHSSRFFATLPSTERSQLLKEVDDKITIYTPPEIPLPLKIIGLGAALVFCGFMVLAI